METAILNNGVIIPKIGFGVYEISPRDTKKCVLSAFECGYRHIDTSFYYHNEAEVGEAIKASKIKRSEIFVTTKITGAKTYAEACAMIDLALSKLKLDYIDMMLIHWPSGDTINTYKAMEDYYRAGKLRAIGLSNFFGKELDKILNSCKITPAVNQIETHVFRNQKTVQKMLENKGIITESWSPLASGENNIFSNSTLIEIGKKHNKSAAQVALRYLIERNVLIIPRSQNIAHMKENLDIFDFVLDKVDITKIEKLSKDEPLLGWY